MKYKLLTIFFFFKFITNAQVVKDSIELPFAIAKEKQLSEEDLANKKEGIYVTGVPDISSDPINGFGYGAEGALFFNGKRSDPFFSYTPYRASLGIAVFNTTREQREFLLQLDIPYIFDTKWRFRAEAGYESNPNLLYFGKSESSLNGLSYFPNGDNSQPPINNATYSDYENNLDENNQFYNTYIKKEYILNVSLEHSFLEGRFRTLFGFEFANVGISTFSGNNLLQNENYVNPLLGMGNNNVSIFQSGLIYDTRDLETDPNQGVFAELTNELSLKVFGSAFNFNKTFFHINYYHKMFPKIFKKMVFASRFAYGYTAGDSPFFEYQDQWSSEGSIEGLGGANTLRGFKQGRFLARVMNFNNFEIRYRFAQTHFLKQHIALSGVPFIDFGGVWDDYKNSFSFNNYRFSQGIGLRIVWNVNTILRFDYAISREDNQFFFNFGHCF
jgi:hypothetical protein